MSAEEPKDRPDEGGERADWQTLESSGDLDSSTARALKDLERIATFSRDLQRTATVSDAASMDPERHPKSWGHLMLLERVGAGAQGEVWRAWDASLQRQVALKFLQFEWDQNRAPSSDLVAEARALARVRHPGVVSVYGVAEHDGRTGMWMEWIEGATLARDIERRGALPAREVERIGLELCSALEALEGAGIVHRDVKPANIVLETGGRVVLTDFGLGWRPALEDTKARMSGTPFFMAPELLRGAEPSPRSDLYALGVTFWWALAGRAPFQSKTVNDLRNEAARGPSTPLRVASHGAPEPLVDAIEWAMRPGESERPSSAAQLRERLAPATAGDAEAAPRGWMSRFFSGRGAWLKICAAAMALAGLSWWIASGIRSDRGGGMTGWTARQVPMPPEVTDNSDYSLSPDGTKIAYVSDSSTALSVFSIDANDARVVDRLAPGEGVYSGVEWTLNGLAVSRRDTTGEAAELLVDPITGRREVLASLGKMDTEEFGDLHASLSPDGRSVALRGDYRPAGARFRSLQVLDVRSGIARALIHGDGFIDPPVWSPDGTRLAYLLSRGENEYARMETCDLRGKRTTAVEDSTGDLMPYSYPYRTLLWTDSKRILYARRRPGDLGQSDWWSIGIDQAGHPSEHARLIYSLAGASVFAPSMSRNGVIAFTGERRPRRLELIGTDGSPRYPNLEQGIQTAGLGFPVWSPDGTSLFVRSDENPPRYAIKRFVLSTGRFESIMTASVRDQPLCPTPDGRELLCAKDSMLVAMPLLGGTPRVLAESFLGTVLHANQANRWVSIQHVGTDLVVRDFSPTTGPGSVRFRYPVPGLGEQLSPTADLSPDGTRIVVLRGDSSGYDILDAETGRVVRTFRMPSGSWPQSVRWMPDGKVLYATGLSKLARFWIARLDPDGKTRVIWKSDDVWPGYLAISPDGSTLAFTTLRFNTELWILQRP